MSPLRMLRRLLAGRAYPSEEPRASGDEGFVWRGPPLVDIHCHCLIGVDDGPADAEAALALCRGLVAGGVARVVATPHQLGRYEGLNVASDVRREVDRLRALLAGEGIPLEVVPGGEVRIDERLPELIDADGVMTFADAGRALLLELPHGQAVDPRPALELVLPRGVVPVLAHPERHAWLFRAPAVLEDWTREGGLLQVNAPSLLGEAGSGACERAWSLVEAGEAACIAGDAHDALRRPPRLGAAAELLALRIGREAAHRLAVEVPTLLAGGAVPPDRSTAGATNPLRQDSA